MQKYKDVIITMVSVWGISAIIGWVAGYDFNHRGLDVLMWVIITILISYLVALMKGDLD